MTIDLIDVSNNNGRVDWAAVAAAGIAGAWCKVTEGPGYVDRYWQGPTQNHRTEAAAAGLRVGGYHFAQPGDPIQQARFFANHYGGPSSLPAVLDLESSAFNTDSAADFALVFLPEVERLIGHPMLYTFSGYPLRNDPRLTQWPLWLANYPGANNGTMPGKAAPAKAPWRAWSCWQYTSGGTVAGVGNRCDRNTANVEWWASLGQPPVIPAPSPPPPPEDTVTLHLISKTSDPGNIYWTDGTERWHAVAGTDQGLQTLYAAMKIPIWNPAASHDPSFGGWQVSVLDDNVIDAIPVRLSDTVGQVNGGDTATILAALAQLPQATVAAIKAAL
jgi:GH25 family lysozyme M1 (1,4-beta-N-acetylmuramidase)